MQASKNAGTVLNGEKLGLQLLSQQWGAAVPVWHKMNELICLGRCMHALSRVMHVFAAAASKGSCFRV